MSLAQMGRGGGQGGGAVYVQLLVIRIGLILILNCIRGDYIVTGRVLGSYRIFSSGANTLMLAGEGANHRWCNF